MTDNTLDALAQPPKTASRLPTRTAIGFAALLLLLVGSLTAHFTGHAFYLDIATRLTILAIAAVSLNLILGYGGMISFGHAAYIGIGAYAVGIPAYYDIYNGLIQVPIAVGICALFALVTGAISLRTKGVSFIMITRAFAQMAFFTMVSLDEYGGDDGLTIFLRSEIPFLDMEDNLTLFLVCYVSLLAVMFLVHRLINSRFGMVIRGARSNEARMRAIGYNTYVYRLTAYVIAGAICGYAGALYANFSSFISPDAMAWSRSGELMFMVILGGAGTFFGPLFGTAAFLLLEEVLSGITVHWHLIFGVLLILAVLFMKGGISGLIRGREGADD
ncbi:MAG: branched-chain amino acid ABC transporter permease [Pseudomonadota bacterium]